MIVVVIAVDVDVDDNSDDVWLCQSKNLFFHLCLHDIFHIIIIIIMMCMTIIILLFLLYSRAIHS